MKKSKIHIILVIAIGVINLLVSFNFGLPTFASMGSTGGGGGGGSTGGSSGGGGYTSTSSSSSGSIEQDIIEFVVEMAFIIVIALALGIFITIYSIISEKVKEIYIRHVYQSDFLQRKEYVGMDGLLIQPPDRKLFDKGFQALREARVLKNIKHDEGQWEDLKEVYIQAQYLYSQLIRRMLVNNHADLSSLKRYLDKHFFYKTMVKEIKLKSQNQVVDDTVVNRVQIQQIAQFGNLYLTKIKAFGQDKEIQFNHDYDSSFSRSEWSDYVIFGRDKHGQVKIVTLMYGEHAHLNGKNFNHDKSLDAHSKYIQKHYDDLNKK